jgi:uncharacterized membrane protein
MFVVMLQGVLLPLCVHFHCLSVISEAVYKNKVKCISQRMRFYLNETIWTNFHLLVVSECCITYYDIMNDELIYSYVLLYELKKLCSLQLRGSQWNGGSNCVLFQSILTW